MMRRRMVVVMTAAAAPRVVSGATARSGARQVSADMFANPKSGGFVFRLLQEPRRIVQNGACTPKRAFVYRVLGLPGVRRMDLSAGSFHFDLLSQKHIWHLDNI